MSRACALTRANHSADLVTVHDGHPEAITVCGYHLDLVHVARREAGLTRTQRRALVALRKCGGLWPITRLPGGDWQPYSRRTLDALVSAGLARWVTYRPGSGVFPHVVPVTR